MIAIKKRYLSAFEKAFIIDIRREKRGKGDELIRGLDLAKRYWEEVGRPRFEAECPQLFTHGAVGLAGEGSECFGFDDEISRDHDWGPGFCVWLSDADMDAWGAQAKAVYDSLPASYLGYQRLRQDPMSAGRVGILRSLDFYWRFLGIDHAPATLTEWQVLPEDGLATATNGEVFFDAEGSFSSLRAALLSYYPEDIRRRKLAAQCALAAQAGQYNYYRCMRRGEEVSTMIALTKFVEHVQAIIFLLNRRYRPYYKWSQRALETLPVLSCETAPLIRQLASPEGKRAQTIETICAHIIQELKRQGLSDSSSDFLLDHARCIQAGIEDKTLRSAQLFQE